MHNCMAGGLLISMTSCCLRAHLTLSPVQQSICLQLGSWSQPESGVPVDWDSLCDKGTG